jgi:carbon starvation protein
MPGTIITSAVMVFGWAYFIYTGSITTIWPMFGTANQLLATVALAIGTTYIINRGRAKYAWVTIVPMLFVGATTLTAGWMNMANIYYPMISKAASELPGYLNLILTAVIMASVVVILFDAIPKWYEIVKGTRPVFVEEATTKY